MFEEVHRDTLSKLAQNFADRKIKGEVTAVIEGKGRKRASKPDSGK
jgi:16S rRNA C1402 (ribose-2'-O) methylase RsmI